MTPSPADLLQALAGTSGLRTTRPDPAGSAAPGESGAFGRLLSLARSARGGSTQPVSVAPDLALDLRPEQMTRLSDAADRAEDAGAETALVALDGMLLKLDVPGRSVEQRIRTMSGDVIDGIDAFVDASRPGADGASPLIGNDAAATGAGGGVGTLIGLAGTAAGLNPSLVRSLATLTGDGQAQRRAESA